MAKKMALTLGTLLVATNIFWTYQILDQTATMKYIEIERTRAEHSLMIYRGLCNEFVGGMNKANMISLIDKIYPENQKFEKEGKLHTHGISFNLSSDGLNIVKAEPCE